MKYESIIKQLSTFEKATLMTGKNTWHTQAYPEHGIPTIFLSDGPHGIRKQLGSADHLGLNESIKATCFPTAATVANSWDIELSEQVGVALGKEARHLGVNVLLGPGMNIKRNPLCGRNFEYFSEDPVLTGKLAAAYVKGIQSQGVGACPKHYAVNSQELRRMSNDSIVDERTLREFYLKAFEYVVKNQSPKFIMTSYNKVNGDYTNEHEHLLHQILYKDWEYNNAVVTDWGGSNDHVKGVQVGSHLEMPGTGVPSALELVKAIEDGQLDEKILDQRVDELLQVVFDLQTGEEVHESLNHEMTAQHHELAYYVAQQSIVLLKNDAAILPLQPTTQIGIIGDFAKNPRYQGAGSSVVNTTKLETIWDTKSAYGLDDTTLYAQGYDRIGSRSAHLIEEAVAVAKQVDVPLLFVGLTEVKESEGMDREHMRLDDAQIDLITQVLEANPNTVLIYSGGSAFEMPFANSAQTMLHGYLFGQAGAKAMWDILMGKVNPSGKLAETYPLTYESVSNKAYYPGLEKTSEYREAQYVGYRYFDKVNTAVRFPFGHGLSYTQFEYEHAKVTNTGIQVTVRNTGDHAGAEIVQVYVTRENIQSEAIYREAKSLVGFGKVFLQVGESTTLNIDFEPHAFEYYNIKTNSWEVEAGKYQVLVGASSRDIRLSEVIMKESTTREMPYTQSDIEALAPYFTGNVQHVSDIAFETLLGHPIPSSSWDKHALLEENDTVSQLKYAKSPIARFAHKVMAHQLEKSLAKGEPNLNLFFTYNMTFRAFQKMTGGMVTKEMVSHILTIVNGHFFKGAVRLIKAYFNNQKTKKAWTK